MTNMFVGLESWTLARPELFLAAVTALLLLYGVLRGHAGEEQLRPRQGPGFEADEHVGHGSAAVRASLSAAL